ncbi:MAG: hypothetical protein IJP31_06690 [Lachnospiraceae bacterium]|nr:hypothetical protein [Lachnospiraceae bacterium]
MQKKIVLFTILLLVFMGITGCGKTQEEQVLQNTREGTIESMEEEKQESSNEEAIEITEEEENADPEYVQFEGSFVTFTYPGAWSVEEMQGEDGGITIFSDTEEKQTPVLIYETGEAWRFPADNTKEDYHQLLIDYYPDYQDIEIIEFETMAIDNFYTHKLVFTYIEEGQEFTQIQYSLAEGVRFHELRFTYPTKKQKDYQEKIEMLVDTIDFLIAE